MEISFEQIIAVVTLLFGGGVLSFFAKNRQTNRQDKRDDFAIITDALYKRIDALEEDVETIKKRNIELIEENREKGNQIETLKDEIRILVTENKRLLSEKEFLSSERKSLIDKIRSLNERVEKLEKELRREQNNEN